MSRNRPIDEREARRVWIEASRKWSAVAQRIAATAPIKSVGPLICGLARQGRLTPPSDENILAAIDARAREIDPEAWAERDRLGSKRGVSPDRMDQVPQNDAERQMRSRRIHSMKLALDADLVGDDAAVARALRTLDQVRPH